MMKPEKTKKPIMPDFNFRILEGERVGVWEKQVPDPNDI
jgi:hypothetical protein